MPYIEKENNSYKESKSGIETPLRLLLKRGTSTNNTVKNLELAPGECFFEKDTGFLYVNNLSDTNKKISSLNPINIGYVQNIEEASTQVDDNVKLACIKKEDGESLKSGVLYFRTLKSIADYLSLNAEISVNQLQGIIPIVSGGTGSNTSQGAFYNLLSNLSTAESAIQDDNQILLKVKDNFSETNSIYYKEASSFIPYIENKINLSNVNNGIVALNNGGTGATTAKGAEFAIVGSMNKVTSDISDDSIELVLKYKEPNATDGVLYSNSVGTLAKYILNKIQNGSYIGKGIVQIGAGITATNEGVISVTKDNIVGQLGYTPPNMTFNSGNGYLQFGNYKICWGQFTTPKYTANLFQDVVLTGVNFASSFTSTPTVFLQSNSYQGVVDMQPTTVTNYGITSVRIHRHFASTSQVDGVTASYIAIGI